MGRLPRWQGCELAGGASAPRKVRDLADHPSESLGRPFTLEEPPDPVADLLLGALDRPGVGLWPGCQWVHTS